MLSKERVEKYKENLLAEKTRLLEEVRENEEPKSFGSDVDSFDEKTDEVEEFGNQLAIAQALKDRINEIDEALNKMLAGKYGICEKCGQEISESVLKVAPESELCENCKLAS